MKTLGLRIEALGAEEALVTVAVTMIVVVIVTVDDDRNEVGVVVFATLVGAI